MIRKLLLLVVAISAIERANSIPVADVDYVGDRLFKSSPTNYIVAGRTLWNLKQWLAVVRNDDQLVLVKEDCSTEMTNSSRIYLEDFRSVLALKATLEKVARPTGKQLAGITYYDDRAPKLNEADKLAKFYKDNGAEVMVRSQAEFSIKKDMPFGLERVFFQDGDVATLLYDNRRLEIGLIKCMPEDIKSYLEHLKSEVREMGFLNESHE